MMTLSEDVSAAVSDENMEQCMGKVLEKMSQDKKMKKCVESDKYNEEELGELKKLAEATAGIKCFRYLFQEACNKHVGSAVLQALNGRSPAP